jgi:transposase
MTNLTAQQLRSALAIREQIEALEKQFKAILQPQPENGLTLPVEVPRAGKLRHARIVRRRMSVATRRKLAAAQRARWAKVRAEQNAITG